jgi:hypothetical protein
MPSSRSRFHGSRPIPEQIEQMDDAFLSADWEAVGAATLALLRAVRERELPLSANVHPLGFIHALLAERKDGTRLRLHLWPSEPYEPQEPAWYIHCHAWPLRSVVVLGSIQDHRYRVIDRNDGNRQLFEASYQGDHSILSPSGQPVRCEPLSAETAPQGATYEVPLNTFHASRAMGRSVTVVESGRPTGVTPLIVGDPGTTEVAYRRRSIGADELRELLSQFVD